MMKYTSPKINNGLIILVAILIASPAGKKMMPPLSEKTLYTVLALMALLLAAPAAAEPMDLSNPEARWVAVRFEVSPEDRPGQVQHHAASVEKTAEVLGWRAAVPFEEGMDATIRWYRDHPEWWSRLEWMKSIPIKLADGSVVLH